MINDLHLDPIERGSSLLDVNRLLLFEYHLDTSINYFLYHICSVGTQNVNFREPTKDNKIILLQNYLLKFFAPEKNIYLCKASNGNKHQKSYSKITLKELAANVQEIDFGTSLYIPAESPTKINQEYLNLIRGPL